ncbi:6461_t:CDS:2 [Funneliformis geosporum]|uniref:9489_t:CDS:1 n=1 Tax=Funneliformis geosporum TaxID=1117311 RepID=A0A9W4T317_9GLOM|nr:6461_t:CDS:2 [Funneliformis geosporum]CAI2190690.1 9489_t:CDS:2 [Funneliformis geosporum]
MFSPRTLTPIIIRRFANYYFPKGIGGCFRFQICINAYKSQSGFMKETGGLSVDLPNCRFFQSRKRNLSRDTSAVKCSLSVEEIKKWNPAQVVSFLESQKDKLHVNDDYINIIKKANVSGSDFLHLLAVDKLKSIVARIPTNKVHVFVDNSNIWIEGKYAVGELERLGSFDYDRNSYYFGQLRIDYGRLLTTVQRERELGSSPVIVGSRPPPNDSLWERIRQQGYEVSLNNREKKVDATLVCSMYEVISKEDPGVLVLIAGDRDYEPVITQALNKKWIVETWFWNSGMSMELISKTNFNSLGNYYRSFAYGYGPDRGEKSYILEITDGDVITSWEDQDIFKWFNTLNLFGWWNWIGYETLQLYFNNTTSLKVLKTWVKDNHQDVQVRERN